MIRFSPSRSSILALCVAGALFAAPAPGFAATLAPPAIIEAHAEGAMLRITGLELAGGTPKITLGNSVLSIVAATATHIDALLPVDVAPGSYLLTLTLTRSRRDGGATEYDEFWVTVGGAGVAGRDGKDGATGPQGPAGKDGATGSPGKDGAAGPAGKDGTPGSNGRDGKDGATGPAGPAGPPGSGGSLMAIESLAGLPCTVAMCSGNAAITFDPLTSAASLSCIRIPGNYTLRIQGSAAVGPRISKPMRFTSDVAGFAGNIPTRDAQHNYAAFDIPANNLCAGQLVSVTVIHGDGTAALYVQGGSCTPAQLLQPNGAGEYAATCSFTMNGNQILTVQ